MYRAASIWIPELRLSIYVKNWKLFQHYKKRCPPWIRLYAELINKREFGELSGDAVKTLVQLWIIASEDKTLTGKLPAIDDIAYRLRLDSKVLASHLVELKQWIVDDDSKALADCKQVATPETETETETKQRQKRAPRKRAQTIPKDWKQTQAHEELARKLGGVMCYVEAERFKDHFLANGKTMKDWDRAFNNWLRRSKEFKTCQPSQQVAIYKDLEG